MKKSAGIPLLFVAAVLPLVTSFHIELNDFSKYAWFPNQEYWMDFFLYGKSNLLGMMGVLMLAILLIRLIKNRTFVFCKEKILLLLLILFLVLSAVFSKFPEKSLSGSIEQYESLWVLLSYVILAVFSFYYTKNEKNRMLLVCALLFGLAMASVFGVLQFFQCDFWNSEFGKEILIPESFSSLRDRLRFSEDFRGIGRVYMTLYNPTYAGIYLVMLLPFLFLMKNKFVKMMLIPSIICLVGTMSKSAWLTGVILLVTGGWLMASTVQLQKWKFYKKIWLTAGVVCLVMLAGAVFFSKNAVLTEGKRLQEISAEKEYVRVVYEGNTLYMSEFPKDDSVTYKIVDEKGLEPMLLWVPERGEIDSQDPRFDDLHFKVYKKNEIGYIYVKFAEVIFRFTDELGTGKYEYISMNGKPDELKVAKTLLPIGDSLLNGRGYIWNRTIPLMFENVLFGTGPDTFLQVFPQDDYVARANLGYGFFTEILTNAHSFYLQIGLQNGCVVLVCLLCLLGIYLKKSWKMYAHKECYDRNDRIGVACLLGSIGYLICGITFASSVCTTPVFAILVGMGLGMQPISEKDVLA